MVALAAAADPPDAAAFVPLAPRTYRELHIDAANNPQLERIGR